MNIEDRLKNAYENVAFHGDSTWVSNDYQRAHQEFCIREHMLRPTVPRDLNSTRAAYEGRQPIPALFETLVVRTSTSSCVSSNYDVNTDRSKSTSSQVNNDKTKAPPPTTCLESNDITSSTSRCLKSNENFITNPSTSWCFESSKDVNMEPITSSQCANDRSTEPSTSWCVDSNNDKSTAPSTSWCFEPNNVIPWCFDCSNEISTEPPPWNFEHNTEPHTAWCFEADNDLLNKPATSCSTENKVVTESPTYLESNSHITTEPSTTMNFDSCNTTTEPWLLPEVDEIYNDYTKQNDSTYTEQDDNPSHDPDNEIIMNIYKSPMGNFYVKEANSDDENNSHVDKWTTYDKESDLEQIRGLIKAIEELNASISSNKEKKQEIKPEKRLYSAVLQGLPPKDSSVNNLNDNIIIVSDSDKKKEEETENPLTFTIIKEEKSTLFKSTASDPIPLRVLQPPTNMKKTNRVVPPTPNWQLYNSKFKKISLKMKLGKTTPTIRSTRPHPRFARHINVAVPTTSFYYIPNYVANYTNYQLALVHHPCPSNPIRYAHQSQQHTHYPNYPVAIQTPQNLIVRTFMHSALPYQRATYVPPQFTHFIPWLYNNELQNRQNYSNVKTNQVDEPSDHCTRFFNMSILSLKFVNYIIKSIANQNPPHINVLWNKILYKSQFTQTQIVCMSRKDNVKTQNISKSQNTERLDGNFTTAQRHTEDKEEHFLPVQVTISEVLELEALEQYSPTSEEVYQELERQAAEQYEGNPENLM